MTQNITHASNWLITDEDRTRALIKYELRFLLGRLWSYLERPDALSNHADKVIELCSSIANKYWDYLRLLDNKIEVALPELPSGLCRPDHFNLIAKLEQKLTQVIPVITRKNLIIEIISLYKMVQSVASLDAIKQIGEYSNRLKQLFEKERLDLWLAGLIDFWNQYETVDIEFTALFHDWGIAPQQLALDFFARQQFVDLVNAIFFYKLYPDKLFPHILHPEKLISVRTRLGVLHYSIELIQQQLYSISSQNGLTPGIDYLLHGNELPYGVMIEVDKNFTEMIQASIKKLKISVTPQNAQQETLELLYDLGRAYKFWFNPNRLIDAVMVLQQNFVYGSKTTAVFQEEMVILFCQLTTNDCLDLYGYFANNDSRYLLHTFFAITQGNVFNWLSPLQEEERKTIEKVFHALYSVMEALRIELKNRHVITEPYVYDLSEEDSFIGHRNRDAVFRTMALYGNQSVSSSDTIEQLFCLIEDAQ